MRRALALLAFVGLILVALAVDGRGLLFLTSESGPARRSAEDPDADAPAASS